MKNIIIAMGLLLAASFPVMAQDDCLTKEEVKAIVAESIPNSRVALEADDGLMFSSEGASTDLIVMFNEEGCAVAQYEIKVRPTYES